MLIQLTASHQLGYCVKVDIVLQQLDDSDDVRMVSLLQYFQLLLHQIDQCLMSSNTFFVDDFDCNLLVCHCVQT